MTVPFDPQPLAMLAGRNVLELKPVSSESRNSLWRVTLDGDERAILKVYDPAHDPHAANRFRREEKVLTLLGSASPPIAPRVIAGFVCPSTPPMLLMEDVGESSLADVLTTVSGNGIVAEWSRSIEFLKRLHTELNRLRQPLYRTAMAISLDRITQTALCNRFRIAGRRLMNSEASPGVLREYQQLMYPLLHASRVMIHNSMSPLNIVPGPGGWRAIDWETITCASPLWDWVDMLRSPYNALPYDECERICTQVTGCSPDLFDRAVLSRCLDGLATVTLRLRAYREQGFVDRMAEYQRRAACYAGDVRSAAARLGATGALAEWLETMTGGAA